jgi:hypothetical protein
MKSIESKHQRLAALRPISSESAASLAAEWDVRMVHESNAIKGNSLTLRETELVFSKRVTFSGKPLMDRFEAPNLAKDWDRVKSLAKQATNLIERDLLDLHQIILILVKENNTRCLSPSFACREKRENIVKNTQIHPATNGLGQLGPRQMNSSAFSASESSMTLQLGLLRKQPLCSFTLKLIGLLASRHAQAPSIYGSIRAEFMPKMRAWITLKKNGNFWFLKNSIKSESNSKSSKLNSRLPKALFVPVRKSLRRFASSCGSEIVGAVWNADQKKISNTIILSHLRKVDRTPKEISNFSVQTATA